MTAKEIRKTAEYSLSAADPVYYLREIAAQLAEIKEIMKVTGGIYDENEK